MTPAYGDALSALYQASFETFVAERKRLSAELKTAGDTAGATQLAKLARPTVSSWTVNQLWWHEREAFESLFRAAERLRGSGVSAAGEHREALATLRARAAELLTKAGNAATEATLRRVTTTLSALAAAGSFEPDAPGTLTRDRDPPGFEAAGLTAALAETATVEATMAKGDSTEMKRQERAEVARRNAEAIAERRRIESAQAQKQAERERLERKLRTAKSQLETLLLEVRDRKEQLTTAEESAERARAAVAELEARLAELE